MEIREYRIMAKVERTHWWYVSRRLFVGTILRQSGVSMGGKLRIADIGAGTGGMFRFLSRYGTVAGIEPNMTGRKLAASHGIHLTRGTAEKTGLAPHSMDIVCLFDVLYHSDVDCVRALSEVHRILKPGGKLIITDSAMPWLYGPHDVAAHARQRFELPGLVRLICDRGFTVRRQTYLFFLLFPVVAVKRLADRLRTPAGGVRTDVGTVHPLINRILTGLCRLEAGALRYIGFPYGSSLLIVAERA